jgi:hypothetical protein
VFAWRWAAKACHPKPAPAPFGALLRWLALISLQTTPAWLRAIGALVCLLVVALLLRPDPVQNSRSWEDLITPLAPGAPVVRGFRLSPPRRGRENDVVFTAVREREDGDDWVEVHIVDRGQWPGIRETTSFGVAYETPRSSAPIEDQEAVTEAIANAIRRNDTGFATPHVVPLRSEPPLPAISRVLLHTAGARGWLAAALCLVALLLLNTLRWGSLACGIVLVAVGLALRLSRLGLPFVHDQDVQRVLLGHLPLGELITGVGLDDRHPPLFFLLLRALRGFGQAESIVRMPAAVSGALIGAAILWGAWALRGRVSSVAVLLGWVATVSTVLVQRSREVSEIPLFSLVAIGVVVAVARAVERPSRSALIGVAASHAVALWLYYLAPFLLIGVWGVAFATKKVSRPLLIAASAGALLGAPSLWIGARTFLRDMGARAVAARFPHQAWGDNDATSMAGAMLQTLDQGLTFTLLIVVGLYIAASSQRRGAWMALAGAVCTMVAIAGLTPIARMQPYYVVSVAPLLLLAGALVSPPHPRRWASVWVGAVAVASCLLVSIRAPGSSLLYVPSTEAVMPRFAEMVLARPEKRIAVVAHYDATLLAYYLARTAGAELNKASLAYSQEIELPFSNKKIVPLVQSHGMDAQSGERAAAQLGELCAREPILVIERDALRLEPVTMFLRRCEPMVETPTARLLRCEVGTGRSTR